MTTGTKLSYYPGCTLKTRARNLEEAALGALEELGGRVRDLVPGLIDLRVVQSVVSRRVHDHHSRLKKLGYDDVVEAASGTEDGKIVAKV